MTALRQCQIKKTRFVPNAHTIQMHRIDIIQTPVKKTAKPRRKRGEPLAEISANIPRGGNRRLTRDNASQGKSSKPLLAFSRTPSSDIMPTLGQFKRSHDIFRDDDKIPSRHSCFRFPHNHNADSV